MVGALGGGMLLLAACGGANTPAAAPAATSAAVVAATAGPTIAAVATTAAIVAPTVAAVATSAAPTISAAATSAAPTISAAATAAAPVVAAAAPTVAALATTVAAAVAPATGQTVSFKTDVLPIFTANCVSCHGASSGFSAASYADVMKGGRNGQDVKPGDADGSLLVQKVKGTQTIGGRMPRGGGPLPDADIKKISDWVAQGAKDN